MFPVGSDEGARDDTDADSDLPLIDPLLFVCFPHTTLLCVGFVFPDRDVFDDGLRHMFGDRVGVTAGVAIENICGPTHVSGMSSPLSGSYRSIANLVGLHHTLHCSGICPDRLHTTHLIDVCSSSS